MKFKFTAAPHTYAGKAGIIAIFDVVLQPVLTVNPATHALYAFCISVSLAQASNIGSVGQLTVEGVAAATVKVEVQVTGVVLQSSVALNVKLKFTAPPHTNAGSAGIIDIFEDCLLYTSPSPRD